MGYAVVAFLLVGPGLWLARDRFPDEQWIKYVGAGVGILGFIVLVGVEIASGGQLFLFSGAPFGIVVGVALVMVLERSLVPDRLCSPTV